MREVYRRIEGVATTNSTILVLGESGTGKELVAQDLHRHGPGACVFAFGVFDHTVIALRRQVG